MRQGQGVCTVNNPHQEMAEIESTNLPPEEAFSKRDVMVQTLVPAGLAAVDRQRQWRCRVLGEPAIRLL